MKKLLISLFLLVSLLYGETIEDSLRANIENASSLNEQIEAYKVIGNHFLNEKNQYDSATIYFQTALDKAKSISNNQVETSEIYASIALAYEYAENFEKVEDIYQEAINYISKEKNKTAIGIIYYNYAYYFFAQGYYQKSLPWFNKAIANLESSMDSQTRTSFLNRFFKKKLDDKLLDDTIFYLDDTYSLVGSLYERTQNYESALRTLLKNLEFTKLNSNNELRIAEISNHIGLIYSAIKQYDKSLEYFNSSFTIAAKLDSTSLLSSIYNNKGLLYSDIGKSMLAKKYLEMSINIYKDKTSNLDIGITYNNIGTIYSENFDYENALKYYNKAIKAFNDVNDIESRANTLLNLGYLQAKNKEYKEAKKNIDAGLEVITEEVDTRLYLKGIKYKMYLLSKTSPDKEIIRLSELYFSKQEELYSEEMKNKIAKAQAKFGLEEKNKEIELKTMQINHTRQILIISLILGFIFVFLFAYFIWRYYRKHQLHDILIQSNKELEKSYKEIQHAHEEIISLERKNSVLATIVTTNHELNQPLMILRGNLEMLVFSLENNELDEKQKKFVTRIVESIERISDILKKFRETENFKWDQYTENTDMVVFTSNESEETDES